MDNNEERVINKKSKKIKIVALISICLVVSISVLVILFIISPVSGKKLECKSGKGDITIFYNDNEVTGYSSNKIQYSLSTGKEQAKKDGCTNYINSFKYFFEKEYQGTCELK